MAGSGVMDERGNLYIAYGTDGEGRTAGAVTLRSLSYRGDSHGWQLGAEHRVVADRPGRGASDLVLALTAATGKTATP